MNPALHSRIFYKEALSQVAAGFKVTIIGRDKAATVWEKDGVTIVPLPAFSRLSFKRFTLRKKLFQLALAQKADVYQFHSPELIPVILKLKVQLPAAKFIYDVHEDYYKNILFGGYYPKLFAGMLARGVRKSELQIAKECSGIFLAESCFQSIFSGVATPRIEVLNKFRLPDGMKNLQPSLQSLSPEPVEGSKGPQTEVPTLLFTGTIAENWGVFRAVDLWQKLNQLGPVKLMIAGHGQPEQIVSRLKEKVAATGLADKFTLIGGINYTPYEEIVKCIAACTAGLALYSLPENIRERIPTRFYEFMAFGKPVIFTQNQPWDDLNSKLKFGVSVHQPFTNAEVKNIYARLTGTLAFPTLQATESDFSWETESKKMIDFLAGLSP